MLHLPWLAYSSRERRLPPGSFTSSTRWAAFINSNQKKFWPFLDLACTIKMEG